MLVITNPKLTALITFFVNLKDLTVTLSFKDLHCFFCSANQTKLEGSLESSPQPKHKNPSFCEKVFANKYDTLTAPCVFLVPNDHRIDTPALGDTVGF